MKKMKKIIALLIAMVMVFSMSSMAFAAEADGKVTVSGLDAGDTVELYQVLEFDATAESGWKLTQQFASLSANLDDILAGNISSTLAETIAELGTAATKTVTAAGASEEIAVDPGLYLVLVTPVKTNTLYNPGFVSSDYNADNTTNVIDLSKAGYGTETIMKKDTLIVEKLVDNKEETDAYSLGDILTFTINTTIPKYPANSDVAVFKLGDTPTGLTIKPDTVVVKVGDTVVYDNSTAMPAATGTVSASGTSLIIDFAKDYILANGGKKVVVTYDAELTAVDAEEGTAENPVDLEFNPNPWSDSTNHVPDIVEVKTYGLVFEKVDEEGNALADAVFDLYDSAGKKVTDEDGYFITAKTKVVDGHAYVYWSGLKAGTYTVKETTAPTGYIKVADFTITVGADTAKADNPATADVTETNYNADLTGENAVEDPAGNELPSTGGIGTTMFYIVGSVLVIGAVVLLISKRRMAR